MFYPFLEVILFLLCIVVCLYIPGRLVSIYLKLKLDGMESLFVSIVTGMVLFIAVLYPLAWIHAEWFSYVVYVSCVVLAFRKRRKLFVPIKKKFLFSSIFLSVSAIIFSSALTLWGLYGQHIFWTYDDVWHIALIQEIQTNFPPGIPTYAGLHLTGYHFFSDFFLAHVSKLFFITPLSLHFHLFPVFLSFLWALGVFIFVSAWTKKTTTALWAVFLSMFGGSFGYVFLWQGHKEVSLIDGLGILQPARSIYNPPFSFSIVVLLLGLFLLYRYLQTREKRWMVPFIFAVGLLPMIKVYAGMLLYGGLCIITAADVFKKRFFLLVILAVGGLVTLATYGVFVGSSGGLIWFPFWAPQDLLRNFAWYGYDQRVYMFTTDHAWGRLLTTEGYGLVLYLFGNLGTRCIGIALLPLLLLKKKHVPSIFTLSLVAMLLVAILIPLFFIQTGKVFEIRQMGMYYLFFCSFFAAIGLSKFFSLTFRWQRISKIIFFLLFVACTIPSTIAVYGQIWEFSQTGSLITNSYYRALAFLKKQGSYNDTVLVLPPTIVEPKTDSIDYWYKTSTPEVSAFANKRQYLAFGVLEFPGMNSLGRAEELALFLSQPLPETKEAFLKKYQIHYIFSPVEQAPLEQVTGIKKIYGDEYIIYQFSPK